jgi:myo-inositol-1(or 4)-monophosphatase
LPLGGELTTNDDIVDRIREALAAATDVFQDFTPGKVHTVWKSGGDPVTAADRAVDDTLRHMLPKGDEGWFSEETVDDFSRLRCRKVWVVDPLDGTREFVAGIGEFAISIGYVEDGRAIAGGISNPHTGESFVGSLNEGVTYQGLPTTLGNRTNLEGATVLASRSEVDRGEWDRFREAAFRIRPLGSIAYKLARVAAGLEDATWTLQAKNEWDVAAGVALMHAAGGCAYTPEHTIPTFNNPDPRISGLIAHPAPLEVAVRDALRTKRAPGATE